MIAAGLQAARKASDRSARENRTHCNRTTCFQELVNL